MKVDHINALQVGEIYRVEVPSQNFWMVGKVIIPNNGDNSKNTFRGNAIIINSKGEFKECGWCYHSEPERTYQPATPEEKYWLEQCIEKGEYISKDEIDFSKMTINYEIY